MSEVRDGMYTVFGDVLRELQAERDAALRWGNAAMVRFEAMLLTKEEFIAAAARIHRELEAERDAAVARAEAAEGRLAAAAGVAALWRAQDNPSLQYAATKLQAILQPNEGDESASLAAVSGDKERLG